MRRIVTRYFVRNARGEELVVPSLKDLHDLYVHGFLLDEDLVKSERATEWTRAGEFEALTGVRERRRETSPLKLLLLVAALAALAAGIGILLAL